jgi:sodium transport system permease protein
VTPFGAVVRKELLDGLRDRRSLLSLLLFPLVGPGVVAVVLTQTAEQLSGEAGTRLPVVGREHAPGLVRFLEDHGVEIREAPADIEHAVREREVDAVLVVPEDYGRSYRDGKPARVELVVDESRTEAMATVHKVERLIEAHGKQVGALRLLAHGVSPELSEPVKIDKVDLSTPKKRAAVFLNLIPMFVLLASFMGGMYTATDATAGERERGSLEALLIAPVSRTALVLGKWLTTVLFSVVTVTLTLAATLTALSRVPMGSLGLTLSLGVADSLAILAITLPLSLFVAAAQLLVASFARSFKEAQTYLSLMVFAPMLPGMLTTLSPIKTQLWMTAVPVLGQQVILGDIIRGVHVAPLGVILTILSSALGGALCVLATARLFQRERIIFGR